MKIPNGLSTDELYETFLRLNGQVQNLKRYQKIKAVVKGFGDKKVFNSEEVRIASGKFISLPHIENMLARLAANGVIYKTVGGYCNNKDSVRENR